MCSLNRRFELFMAIYRVFELDAVFKWLHPPPPSVPSFCNTFVTVMTSLLACTGAFCVYTRLFGCHKRSTQGY